MSIPDFSKDVECRIFEIKQALKAKLPELIDCARYCYETSKAETYFTKLSDNEEAAIHLLILPIMRILGYSTDYSQNHVELFAQSSLEQGTNAGKVDFAIFFKNDNNSQDQYKPIPRGMIECKALSKIDQTRSDYGDGKKQLKTYYRVRPSEIILPILTSGEQWYIFARELKSSEDNSRKYGDQIEPCYSVSISSLYKCDEELDQFVRMTAKVIIQQFVLQCRDDTLPYDYADYIYLLEQDKHLRKEISKECAHTPKDTFERYMFQYDDPRNDLLRRAGIARPEFKRDRGGANAKRWDDLYKEKIRKMSNEFYTSLNQLYQEPLETTSTASQPVPDDQDVSKPQNTVQTIQNDQEYATQIEAQDSSVNNDIDVDDQDGAGVFTEVERSIAQKLMQFLLETQQFKDPTFVQFVTDENHQDMVKHCNAKAFISYVLSKDPQSKLSKPRSLIHSSSKNTEWFMIYGSRRDFYTQNLAEIEIQNNGAIFFNDIAFPEIAQALDAYCLKTQFSPKCQHIYRAKYRRFIIDSLEDLENFKDIIILAAQCAYQRLQDSNC